MIDFKKAIEIFNYRFSPGIIVANDAEIMKYDEEILQTQTLVNMAMNYADVYRWKTWKDSVPNKQGVLYVLILKGDTEPSVLAYRMINNGTLVFEDASTCEIYRVNQVEAWFELPKYQKPEEA